MKKFSTGAAVLLISGIVCKILGAFFRLPLTNMLGIDGIGIFQLEMSLFSFALVLVSGGVTTALSQLISSSSASGFFHKSKLYLRHAVVISLAFGLLVGALFALLGRYIAGFQKIDDFESYLLFIVLLPLGSLLACFRGYFQGRQMMTPTAVSQIVEQITKFLFGILFAYLFMSRGKTMGVFGAFVGVCVSEVCALLFLLLLYLKKRDKKKEIFSRDFRRATLKEFSSANFPLMLSAVILPLVGAFEGLVIIPRLQTAGIMAEDATMLFGIESGIVGTILNFPLIISIALTTATLPNLTYQLSRGAGGRYIVEKGFKILLYLILPTTFGLIAISRPLLQLLYHNMTADQIQIAFYLMLFGGFSTIFTAIMQFVVMILEAIGDFKYVLGIVAIGGILRAATSFVLAGVGSINIFSLVVGMAVMTTIVCLLGLERIRKKLNFDIKISEVLLLLFGTMLMYFGVYTFVLSEYFPPVINVILGILLGVVVYVVLTISVPLKMLNIKKKHKKIT